MLRDGCINPQIMKTLALCGHGDKILISDGNYPLDSRSGQAEKVYLGLADGVPNVIQVLEVLLENIRVEKAEVMVPEDGSRPEIFKEFQQLLPQAEWAELGRYDFYDACIQPEVRLAIGTGESRTFGNLLITVGVA